MFSPSIQKIIDIFSKFPTVGPRTATRFAFYLRQLPKTEIDNLINSIIRLRESVKTCPFCLNYFEGESTLCPICNDNSRNKNLLCVIEKETDLISLEKTKKYKGLYFILGGTVSRLRQEELKNLKTKELAERLENPRKFGIAADFQEVILAFNPTTEGEATILYLERILKPLISKNPADPLKISRLGKGLPMGAELEYADEETLSSALEGRK